jgi:hypothetical protein
MEEQFKTYEVLGGHARQTLVQQREPTSSLQINEAENLSAASHIPYDSLRARPLASFAHRELYPEGKIG